MNYFIKFYRINIVNDQLSFYEYISLTLKKNIDFIYIHSFIYFNYLQLYKII